MKAPDILDKAAGHMRDRAATYDQPDGERSMVRAIAMFNACHGTALTEAQGWHLMELVKHVRFFSAPGYHGDSVEDGAAYAALRGEAAAAATGSVNAEGRIWVCWKGGCQPVPNDAEVEVDFQDGRLGAGQASDFSWGWDLASTDIVAYRVVA